jgi:hypothetical protein
MMHMMIKGTNMVKLVFVTIDIATFTSLDIFVDKDNFPLTFVVFTLYHLL